MPQQQIKTLHNQFNDWSEALKLLFIIYLHVERLSQTLHQQTDFLFPYWVQVLVDCLAAKNLLPCDLKLHIWVTGPCQYNKKKMHNIFDCYSKETVVNKTFFSSTKLEHGVISKLGL